MCNWCYPHRHGEKRKRVTITEMMQRMRLMGSIRFERLASGVYLCHNSVGQVQFMMRNIKTRSWEPGAKGWIDPNDCHTHHGTGVRGSFSSVPMTFP